MRDETLPDRVYGAALFADVSGSTPLAEALLLELGRRRGAEEVSRQLNAVYDALIQALHRYGGSVIGFSGDAITCWFDGDRGGRAVACAFAMQAEMEAFSQVESPAGTVVSLGIKVAVTTGPARRFVVGDPQSRIFDVLAGETIDHLAMAEHQAQRSEVVLDGHVVEELGEAVRVAAWRQDPHSGRRFGVLEEFGHLVQPEGWPSIEVEALQVEELRRWVQPEVYSRLSSGKGEFLAELRPAAALFLSFGGIQFDADDAQTRLDAYFRELQLVIRGLGGVLTQLTFGDKGSYLCAVIGAPKAHEDAAQRAIEAALELRSLSRNHVGEVKIGISYGQMRAGAYGSKTRRIYGVLGDEVNLAARLMQAAAPGQILVSQAVHQSAESQFTWKRLPEIQLKGKRDPVAVFEPETARDPGTSRWRGLSYALPMVGREAERRRILEGVERALEGRGQILGITAEAGMGKSRLASEAVDWAVDRGLEVYAGECQSYGTKTGYLVWGSVWRAIFGLHPDRSLEEQVGTLESYLEAVDPALLPRLPLLGKLLKFPIPDTEMTAAFDAKLRKTSLEALLVDCLKARADRSPFLVLLDDVHWLDPLSRDLLEALGRALHNLPVLILLAYRPIDGPRRLGVSELPFFTEVPLLEFSEAETVELIRLKVDQLFGERHVLPPVLVEQITEKADGNPFYVEEILNYLKDRDVDIQDERALARVSLPRSLSSLILSRIDQLTENQRVTLRLASVIGRLFHAAWLWGAYPSSGDAAQIKADLAQLSKLELTTLDSPEPELTYLFKHIVTRQVAYDSLPFATRAFLHEQLGGFIERSYADRIDEYLDALAHHYSLSENGPKAREYLLKAGAAAQASYANEVAIDYYRRLLPFLGEAESQGVKLSLAQVLEVVGEWKQTEDLYRQVKEAAEARGDRHAVARCQAELGELFRKQGRYEEAAEWLSRAHAEFEALEDRSGIGQVLHFEGTLAAQHGDYEGAQAHYEASLEIRKSLADALNIASLLNNLGIVARFHANYEEARQLQLEALEIRRELGDRRLIAVSLNNLGNVALDQGRYHEASDYLEEALARQREVGDRWAIALSLNNLANAARAQGDLTRAGALYAESLAINRELGDKWALAYLLEDIGALAALQDHPVEAVRLTSAAQALRERIGAPRSEAEEEKLARLLQPARAAMDAEAQASAEAAGQALSLDRALEEALSCCPGTVEVRI